MHSKRMMRASAPRPQPVDTWEKKFNALCYEVFHRHPQGKALLEHLEVKFFRSPVAHPNMEPSWAFFNEGKNELIRSFTNAIQKYLNESKPKTTGNKLNV